MDKQRKSWWQQMERGQALVEYWPAIPAAILVMIVAGGVAGWLNNSFSQTNEALGRAGIDECAAPTDDGPTTAAVDNHQVETSSTVYDGTYTTVTFTVSSGASPSISHWVIALPRAVADNIVDSSEAWSWVNNDPSDPSGNGLTGIKFDTGYEGTGGGGGGGGGGGNGGGGNGGGGNGGNGGNGRGRSMLFGRFTFTVEQTGTEYFVETRDIIMVFSGQYTFDSVDLAIKAGTEYNFGTISAPVAEITEDTSPSSDSSDLGCGS
jgi:hypothetical protein